MKKISRRSFLKASSAAALAMSATSLVGCSESEYPTKDISMTVCWAAGGVTDLTVRAASAELATAFGVNVTIVNTAGGSGSVGTISVQDGTKDGYNLLGAGLQALVTYPVFEYTDVTYEYWDFYTLAYAPNLICVSSDSPYNDLNDLIDALRDGESSGNLLSCAHAGTGSGGHTGAEIFTGANGADVAYKAVAYDGGANTLTPILSGECDFNCQLTTELLDMVRAGDFRALAVLSPDELVVDDIVIPSILDYLPGLESSVPMGETISYCIPDGVPEEVLEKFDEVMPGVTSADSFTSFCDEKGMVPTYNGRDTSQDYVGKLASAVCWTLYNGGTVSVSPADFGFAEP